MPHQIMSNKFKMRCWKKQIDMLFQKIQFLVFYLFFGKLYFIKIISYEKNNILFYSDSLW
ncbi:hypothetical protein HK13_07280 [Acetobacter indonesiensis]|nr:hypothetical protein HK13_07280 [Acetobacter indonesiensis]